MKQTPNLGSNLGGKARMKGGVEVRFVVGIDGGFFEEVGAGRVTAQLRVSAPYNAVMVQKPTCQVIQSQSVVLGHICRCEGMY